MIRIIKETIEEMELEDNVIKTEYKPSTILTDIFIINSTKKEEYEMDFNLDYALAKSIFSKLEDNYLNPTILKLKYKKNNFNKEKFIFKFSIKDPFRGAVVFTIKCTCNEEVLNKFITNPVTLKDEVLYNCFVKTEYVDFCSEYEISTYAETMFEIPYKEVIDILGTVKYENINFKDIYGRSVRDYILKNIKTLIG